MKTKLTRRGMIKTGIAATAALVSPGLKASMLKESTKVRRRIPVVHTTDLYHPPQDPDDQVDLATVLALEEFDLKGVILDNTQRFLVGAPEGFDVPREPGYIPIRQIGYLLDRTIPVATGPIQPLASPHDTAEDRPLKEQEGIDLLLKLLDRSPVPVLITVVGSARVVTAAFNRNPKLMLAKTRAVVVNAGSTGGHKREWNVGLDLHAFVGLWRSGLPIDWYPCGTEKSAFVRRHERGTYWHASHKALFANLPEKLKAWFAYGFSGSTRSDFLKALDEMNTGPEWDQVLEGERNLWSTGSLVMSAGRILAKTPAGWRFVQADSAAGLTQWPWRMDPISAEVSDAGKVDWRLVKGPSPTRIFGRKPDVEYGQAMVEALNALLKSLPV